jgi:hypothetical protein
VSVLHMRHIKSTLERLFKGRMDLSDVQKRPEPDLENHFLTRSLAAYALMVLGSADENSAAKSVTDEFNDNGLDLIHHDRASKTLYLVQAKWIRSGDGTPDIGEIHKFVAGVKDLVNTDFSRFGEKIRSREKEVTEALDDSDTKIVLTLAYTGKQNPNPQIKRVMKDLLEELNDTSDMVSLETLTQAELHQAVSGQISGGPIDLEVGLLNWGSVSEPFQAWYGHVTADLVADWWNKNRNRLFTENLRNYRGSTEVNEAIQKTLESEPENFLYLNNGLTALCASVQKKMIGGTGREVGVFDCKGVSIVNGAQTVGSIAAVYNKYPEKVRKARILLRLLSLENCPEGFGMKVTVATNTQNRVDRVDFVALDPEQQRLRTELWFERKEYVYKSGDPMPKADEGCNVTDATVALACAHKDIGLAVQAKREVGKLWDNINRPPYRLIFNQSLTAVQLWRAVEVMRAVDATLSAPELSGRTRLVAVHGNRFVLHKVFRTIPDQALTDPDANFAPVLAGIRETARKILDAVANAVNNEYKTSYPASLFKNLTKCRRLSELVKV